MAPVRSDSSISPSMVDAAIVAFCVIDAFLIVASLIFVIFLCCWGGDEATKVDGKGKKGGPKKKRSKKGGEDEADEDATTAKMSNKTSPVTTTKDATATEATEAVTETNADQTSAKSRKKARKTSAATTVADPTVASATAGPGGGAGPSITAAKTAPFPTMITDGRTRAPSALDATAFKSRTQAPFVATQVGPKSLVSKTTVKAPGEYIDLSPVTPKNEYISMKSATRVPGATEATQATVANTVNK